MTFGDQSAINAHYDAMHYSDTHVRVRGAGEYGCDVCGKRLSSKRWLKQHLATVHGVGDVKKFQCDICRQEFTQKVLLRNHIKKKHS